MKKHSLILIIIVFTLLIISCTSENEINAGVNKPQKTTNNLEQNYKQLPSDTLFFQIAKNNYLITHSSKLNKGSVTSSLTVKKYNDNLFSISYNFDTNKEHWKLFQSNKVIEKSTELKNENISIQNLTEVNNLIEDYIAYIFSEIMDKKNKKIVSTINYHKSIINTTIRSIENEDTCNCTVHPEFLIDKSFFNCQEDHFYNTSALKSALNQYTSENSDIDSSTNNLITFLSTYEEQTISYNKYYSFYVTNEDFQIFINYQTASSSGNCAWWCPLGGGSDHGCCGNYSGCCLYWHAACYIHDKMCSDCKPSWFCLPGCVPDAQQPPNNTLTLY
ncbi:hypothetical protein [Ichthyenterobacterium magnum]|uniref:Uncharacterized protein n=1 Tax=Ichthyenterobacterium magnum TaxID=1230530 RepID=A0A420DGX1_9FLAO|nr:hypothetical protein [Ichthyenterobacterium magnum]RKE92332.1 hypothetical protein BXY80_2251 [Ichthyenterobacterium magnum]